MAQGNYASYSYRTESTGDDADAVDTYILLRNHAPFQRIGPTVAVAYSATRLADGQIDFERVVMHKHGAPQDVREWAQTSAEAFAAFGQSQAAQIGQEIEVLEGAIPLSDLNRIVESSGYLGTFLKRLHAYAKEQDSDGRADRSGELELAEAGEGEHAYERPKG